MKWPVPPTGDEWHADMKRALDCLPQGKREDFEERAAIMEYDGGLARRDAERRAWEIVVQGIRGPGTGPVGS